MHCPTRAIEIIKIAYNKFNLKEDKELYAEIIEGIERTEREIGIRLDENKLISIIKVIYQLIRENKNCAYLGEFDAEFEDIVMQAMDFSCSRRLNEIFISTMQAPPEGLRCWNK